MKTAKDQVAYAREILAGKVVSAQNIYKLAEDLREEGVFSYARKLFAQLRRSQAAEEELVDVLKDTNIQVKLALKHSRCTYEDPDLPVDSRFQAAIEILKEVDDLHQAKNSDVLNLAGDIYTRKWEADNQKNNLDRAYCYYYQAYQLAGFDSGASKGSSGYAAINAAFLLDRLAQLELEQAEQVNPDGISVETVLGRRQEARRIRKELVDHFTPIADEVEAKVPVNKRWWVLVTLAEAHFGLAEHDQAAAWLTRAGKLPDIPERKFEAIARRFVALYRLRAGSTSFEAFEESKVAEVLTEFLAHSIQSSKVALEGLFAGRVGLALSGNGFRACFFHVGVLAKLAELGLLKKVEVLSCTSGGSIVGTHYYLELRKLLQSKTDAAINDEDYIEVVKRVERALLAGVQKDLQTRSKTNPWINLKTVFKKNYSRTDRIGELLEKEVFCLKRGDEDPHYLRDLVVYPAGEPKSFKPKKNNWRRAAKVPLLVLNATTLNTGHKWQFTASWMGEPAGPINSDIDGNLRLRQVRFEEAPGTCRDFSIGRAVAASACVPGFFEPLAIDRLYPDMTVRLMNGGASDPLAITPLLDQGCTFLMVSDASGSTDVQMRPDSAPFQVASRSDRIGTSHLREAEYNSLLARHQSSLLQDLLYVHLKKDLQSGMVHHIACPQHSAGVAPADDRSAPLTSYGIRKEVQERLAKIRLEFDAFSDTEAYALMTSGYLITDSEFSGNVKGLRVQPTKRPDWRFLAIEEEMKKVGDSDLLRLLDVAQNRILRVWKLSKAMPILTILLGLGLVSALGWMAMRGRRPESSEIGLYLIIFLILGGALLLMVLLVTSATLGVLQIIRREKTMGQNMRGLGTLLFGWIGSWVQLLIFDEWYLALGNIKGRGPIEAEHASKWSREGLQNAIRDTLDKASKASGASIVKALSRFDTVDAVSKLFEANGYEVSRFPRDKEINPFQLNLDLFASKGSHRIFADIKIGPSTVDWKDASGLKIAASLLSSQSEKTKSEPQNVDTMLILIDVPLDESLRKFSDKEGVKLVRMDGEGLKRILDKKGDTDQLRLEAHRLELFTDAVAAP